MSIKNLLKDKITKRTSIRFSIIERTNYYFSDSLKKHNNSIELVKETENQSKEAAPISDFLSSYKGDNSPPNRVAFEPAALLFLYQRCCRHHSQYRSLRPAIVGLSVSRQGVVFLIVLAAAYYSVGYMGIVVSQAVSDVITFVIALALFRKYIYKELR